jgi:UDP-sulfoquinovose synthase
MKVLITGIDGYTGWPLALHLLGRGHEVAGIDNFVTRRRVQEVGSWSATPIGSFAKRQEAVRSVLGKSISFHKGDVTNYDFVHQVLESERPDSIVHLGEQRSAPYSMIDVHHAVRTQTENIGGTLNLLYAIKEFVPDCHLVKMGTMGEYGTPNIDIAEGFFDVEWHGRKDPHLPFPRQAGSWYHWSKVHDSGNVMFATRVWGLRSTDVMQGVVYGIRTPEMVDDKLLTRFDFDEVWGTALNRFVVEAILGLPITPYGKGGQTRGYIALEDSMQSLRLSVENPVGKGEYRVVNQFDAAYSVNQLAEVVRDVAKEFSIDAHIEHVHNPRVESEEHYYHPLHDKLPAMGYRRTRELAEVVRELFRDLRKYRRRLEQKKAVVMPATDWRKGAVRSPPTAPTASPLSAGPASNRGPSLGAAGPGAEDISVASPSNEP